MYPPPPDPYARLCLRDQLELLAFTSTSNRRPRLATPLTQPAALGRRVVEKVTYPPMISSAFLPEGVELAWAALYLRRA